MKTLKNLARGLLLAVLLAPALSVAADYVVIVNANNHVGSLSKAEVQRFFLRNATSWPGGEACKPVDLPKSNPVRAAFAKDALGKTLAALDQFWTHSIFSGRAVPPPEKRSEREVVEYVRDNPGAIGYVSPGAPLEGVKKITVGD